LDRFDALISKIIFKKYKNIILIHFSIKNTLKNNYNHTSKHPEPGWLNEWVKQLFFFFLIKEERVSIIYREQGGPSSIIITFFFSLLWVIYLEKVAGQNDGLQGILLIWSRETDDCDDDRSCTVFFFFFIPPLYYSLMTYKLVFYI
jgi:hypothetical protein